MGGKRRGNKGKDKGKMKVGDEGQGSVTGTEMGEGQGSVTETEMGEQGAGMETVKQMEKEGMETVKQMEKEEQGAIKETEEDDLLDCCVFLVRTQSDDTPPQPIYEKSGLNPPICYLEEFHLIDLRSKSVIPNYLPSIINCVGSGAMLKFDNRQVYILGDIKKIWPQIPHTHINNNLHIHTGSSRTSIHNCWNPFVLPNSNKKFVNPAVLSNKLYCFGYPFFRPEVYDPHDPSKVVWKPLMFPDNLVDKRVSMPVLPDPSNNRILVHFSELKMIYAFYPTEEEGGYWKCIVPKFSRWHYAVAISDNILYFHSNNLFPDFAAYDINTCTSLPIIWDFSKVDRIITSFDGMFTLSEKGLMCLVSKENGYAIAFLRFRMKRTSDIHLKFTAIDYQTHAVPPSMFVNDIILF